MHSFPKVFQYDMKNYLYCRNYQEIGGVKYDHIHLVYNSMYCRKDCNLWPELHWKTTSWQALKEPVLQKAEMDIPGYIYFTKFAFQYR